HFGHLVRLLGKQFPMADLSQTTLQDYANKRSKMKWRGGTIRSATIKKELISLRTAWNWGEGGGVGLGRFPSLRQVRLQKPEEKPPFQTWAEIERRIALGGLTKAQIEESWNCLFLQLSEIDSLLQYVKEHAQQPWVYPMFCFAAHTGAR